MSQSVQAQYAYLKEKFQTYYHFQDALNLLEWDFETTMPTGAGDSRGAVMSTLTQSMQDVLTGADVQQAFDDVAQDVPQLSAEDQKNFALMQKEHQKLTALPATLNSEIMAQTTKTLKAWHAAREANDFTLVQQELETTVALQRQKAEALAKLTGTTPYEALMGEYVMGLTEARVQDVFDGLSQQLPFYIQQAEMVQSPVADLPEIPLEAQKVISKKLMEMLNFDTEKGRLDEAVHPFCGGATDDVRLTTNYKLGTPLDGFLAVGHETGHGLYEQGLPEKYKFQPLGKAPCLAVHESQSLFVENKILKSPEFATWLQGELAQECPSVQISTDEILGHLTKVSRSFIRIEADEVTYPAHVLMRFEIERDVINGDLEVADIPQRWSDLMQKKLGITPPSDKQGVLQDIHWYGGGWGYFPSYTLGALAAAQFAEAAEKDMPDMMQKVSVGDFKDIRQWLKKNIHEKGANFESLDDLLTQATGKPLTIQAYLDHIDERYCHKTTTGPTPKTTGKRPSPPMLRP